MNIRVCVKQVPDMEGALGINPETGLAANLAGQERMDRASAHALEEALILKDQDRGHTITALTLGPPSHEPVLRRALAMGADRAVHLLTEDAPRDHLAMARALASALQAQTPDLVLCGAMSEDLMAGATGPMLAALLDVPFASGVVELRASGDTVEVVREVEGGARETLLLQLPAVLGIQSQARQPRYPTLTHMLRAGRQTIGTVSIPALETAGLPPRLKEPLQGRAVRFLTGAPEEKARDLFAILQGKGLVCAR
jgi:electron transfer flavoprotein beta subunit